MKRSTRRTAVSQLVALMMIFCCLDIHAQQAVIEGTETQFQQAMAAIEAARNYEQLESTFIDYETALGDSSVQAALQQALASDQLGDEQRVALAFASAINREVRNHGAITAAQLTAIRHLALTALSAEQTDDLLMEMELFTPLAAVMNADMVSAAFAEPAGFWPDAMQPLFIEFGALWPAQGSYAAVSQLQNSAQQYIAQTANDENPGEEAGATSAQAAEPYFEDRVADTFLELGMPIPDLIP